MTDARDTTERAAERPVAAPAPLALTVTVRLTAAPGGARASRTTGRALRPAAPAARAAACGPDDRGRIDATGDAGTDGAGAYDRGFADGAAAGAALGRKVEALRWAGEVERWRRLVRWTAAQRGAG